MPGTFKKVCQMAQSMNNAGLRRSLRPVLANKKEVAHLLRHQRSKNDPGGGKPLAPSHLYIASSIRSNLRAVPIACLFKIAQS